MLISMNHNENYMNILIVIIIKLSWKKCTNADILNNAKSSFSFVKYNFIFLLFFCSEEFHKSQQTCQEMSPKSRDKKLNA